MLHQRSHFTSGDRGETFCKLIESFLGNRNKSVTKSSPRGLTCPPPSRYVDSSPDESAFPETRTNPQSTELTNHEDVLRANSCVVHANPGCREVITERVLSVAAAGVDGDLMVVARAAQWLDQHSGVALVNDDMNVSSTAVAKIRLQLCQRITLILRRLHVIIKDSSLKQGIIWTHGAKTTVTMRYSNQSAFKRFLLKSFRLLPLSGSDRGRAFHRWGPATEKLLSLYVTCLREITRHGTAERNDFTCHINHQSIFI